MNQEIDPAKEMLVDRSSYASIEGAISADIEASQATIKRRKADGEEEQVTLHYPAGLAIVRRR